MREKTGRLVEDQRNRLRLQLSAQSLTCQGVGCRHFLGAHVVRGAPGSFQGSPAGGSATRR